VDEELEDFETLDEYLLEHDATEISDERWDELVEHYEVELEDIDVDIDPAASELWEPGEEFDIDFWEDLADEDYPDNDFEEFERDS
jgi:hypothetical protein